MEQPTSYSFWDYDHFPYLLGGPVLKREFRQGKGWIVTTTNFGGYSFNEVANIPLGEGKELKVQLETLKLSQNQAIKRVRKEYEKKLDDLLEKYGIKRKG